MPLLSLLLLAASFLTPVIGGKVLGIGQELQEEANEQIPRFVEMLWKLTCFFVMMLITLVYLRVDKIGGFQFPFTYVHAVIIFYLAAAFRDFFLIRFYFGQDF